MTSSSASQIHMQPIDERGKKVWKKIQSSAVGRSVLGADAQGHWQPMLQLRFFY